MKLTLEKALKLTWRVVRQKKEAEMMATFTESLPQMKELGVLEKATNSELWIKPPVEVDKCQVAPPEAIRDLRCTKNLTVTTNSAIPWFKKTKSYQTMLMVKTMSQFNLQQVSISTSDPKMSLKMLQLPLGEDRLPLITSNLKIVKKKVWVWEIDKEVDTLRMSLAALITKRKFLVVCRPTLSRRAIQEISLTLRSLSNMLLSTMIKLTRKAEARKEVVRVVVRKGPMNRKIFPIIRTKV
jgi:hypothetical protein